MKLIVRWILLAAALLLVANLYAGVSVASFGVAMIAALVLGLLNTALTISCLCCFSRAAHSGDKKDLHNSWISDAVRL